MDGQPLAKRQRAAYGGTSIQEDLPCTARRLEAGTYRARRAAAAGPSAACQRCCWCRLGRASPIARAGAIGGQVRHRVILTARAISVPFRARRHRFATVSHGNSRPLDLGVLYYRCAAARMVRMGSLDRPVGHIGATPHPNRTDNTGQRRPLNIAVQQPFSTSIAGRPTTPVLSRTEEARGSNPLTSTPNLAGQSVASVERAALTAGRGRATAASASRSPARKARSNQVTRPWTFHGDHGAWSPPPA